MEVKPKKQSSSSKKVHLSSLTGYLRYSATLGYYYMFLLLVALVVIAPSPVICQNLLELSVNEELPVNSFVGNIINAAGLGKRYDATILSQLQFQILTNTGNAKDLFKIDTESPNSPSIVTKTMIDRDEICAFLETCDINIDIGIQPTEYFEILKFVIHVVDVNDNSPAFPRDVFSLYISENAGVDDAFAITPAEDRDSGEFGVREYQLLNHQGTFRLEVTENGDGTLDLGLVLKAELDREQNAFYALRIVATDGGRPVRSGTTTVEVSVLDSNDNRPQFEQPAYEVFVYENEPVGTPIIQVRASDLDEGPHGEIEYSFSRQSDTLYGHLFTISRVTGDILTRDLIDYETSQEYSLRVVATDKGPSPKSGYTQVHITVRDLNDNAPVITVNALSSSDSVEVRENRDSGEFVAHISVSDPDGGSNGQVICSVDDSANFRLVTLFPTEFKIVTSVMFNREAADRYRLTLTCMDRGSPVPQVSVRAINVSVIDVNDQSPVFGREQYSVQLQENGGPGGTVLTVGATDRDAGDNARIQYSLVSTGIYGSGVLEIDPVTGDISVTTQLDYELHNQYTYNIIARDNPSANQHADQGTSNSATATLVLTIIDVNDEVPTFSQPRFVFTVREDLEIGSHVGTIMAYDLDSPPYNVISYSVLAATGSEEVFAVDEQSGVITTRAQLDKEQMDGRQSYDFIVTASNKGFGLQNSVEVSVFIDDVNDNAPVIHFPSTHNASVQVKSSAKEGAFVAQIIAHDQDMGKNALLRYSIHPSGNELFRITEDTGRVYVRQELHNFAGNEVNLLIEVSDTGDSPLSTKSQLIIVINATVLEDPAIVTDLNFVIAVVVSSVAMVALAVLIFVIFLVLRRRQSEIKKKVMYACTVVESTGQKGDNLDSTSSSMVSTVSDGVVSPDNSVSTQGSHNWPGVLDINKVFFCDQPSSNSTPNGKDALRQTRDSAIAKQPLRHPSDNRRVTFRDSLESVCQKQPHGSAGCSQKKMSPVFREEGRHKLLYGWAGTHAPTSTHAPTGTHVPTGTHAPTGTHVPTGTHAPTGTHVPTGTHAPTGTHVPTGTHAPTGTHVPTGTHAPTGTHVPTGTHAPTPLYNAPHVHGDDDSSSDQGSSIDSGRGPSEEDQDHNRSGQHDYSHDNLEATMVTSKHHNMGSGSEYMCMDQAPQRVGDNMRYNPSSRRSNSDLNRYSPSGERLPTLPPRKPQNSRGNRLQPPSYHSSNHVSRLASSSAPEITLDKHNGCNADLIPGIHRNYQHSHNQPIKTHAAPKSSYSDINGKNIGRYNCKNPSQSDAGHYGGGLLTPNHSSGSDFPSGSQSGPDSVSDGGSNTSGSYIVDLGAEVSGDVFV